MPNWVVNRLKIIGPNKSRFFKKLLVKDEEGELRFDFNKIVPMPASLNIPCSTQVDKCIDMFMYHQNRINGRYFNKYMKTYVQGRQKKFHLLTEEEYDRDLEYLLKQVDWQTNEKSYKSADDIHAMGKQALDNISKYGYRDWYDWSIANWGTKWNSCNVTQDGPNVVCFDTAWSNVRGLIYKLSRLFPNNTFYYEYAEEDIGAQAGSLVVKNGKAFEDLYYEPFSKEAYELSFDIWGEDIRQDYKFDEKKGTYIYRDEQDEEME